VTLTTASLRGGRQEAAAKIAATELPELVQPTERRPDGRLGEKRLFGPFIITTVATSRFGTLLCVEINFRVKLRTLRQIMPSLI
jgi:hypothetical protein